ncbi:MAG: tryptophan synthase subunit alpha [Acidobacteria bacterium 37-65-4]|nr:MAG: tryptophan synthase subunit alpha [Acidobacteria bacterium 37-65-4]
MSILQERLSQGHALMPYLTASDPSEEGFMDAALGAVEGGASALEVGIPFSDPVADGPVIQLAHQRALAAGGSVSRSLDLMAELRRRSGVPVALFTYFNPLLAYGAERFVKDARTAGAQGVLVLDLPPEEEPDWYAFSAAQGLDPIVLDSPNTSPGRAARIVAAGRGFVYVVSREGVTGTHAGTALGLEARLRELRRLTDLPLAVGFGIRTHEDVEAVWEMAECAVAGSAFVECLRTAAAGERRAAARAFVNTLVGTASLTQEITP